jgi:hypothetical protein
MTSHWEALARQRADVPNEKTHNNELKSRNLVNGFPVYVTKQFHI